MFSIGLTKGLAKYEVYIAQTKLTVSQGFSWEKLPPQRVMRGHRESFVRTYI